MIEIPKICLEGWRPASDPPPVGTLVMCRWLWFSSWDRKTGRTIFSVDQEFRNAVKGERDEWHHKTATQPFRQETMLIVSPSYWRPIGEIYCMACGAPVERATSPVRSESDGTLWWECACVNPACKFEAQYPHTLKDPNA